MTTILRAYHESDEDAVVDLWQRCNLVRPQNDPRRDIQRKLQVHRELFLVATLEGVVVGSVMVGYEGHRGWINYLAVSPSVRRAGIGRALMQAAERLLRERGCPKINLQVRTSNRDVIAFYQAIGFLQDDVISFGKRLEHDS